ncbi:MAG: phosphoribosylamine--glycine ligase [Candidatus Cloacimonetes bacterium]|nr:phosphoribosylamine--glycine ligase [Candidatus Cloacimonadota bacterium]
MQVAVLGSGGREHAIAWKLNQSSRIDKIFSIPGNGGTSNNILLDIMDFKSIAEFCRSAKIDVLVVGPEAPLAAGITDYMVQAGIRVFGPNRQAARLESSKVFAKQFMKKHGVASAAFTEISCADKASEGRMKDFFLKEDGCVIKYDGLAGGKGVYVCDSPVEVKKVVGEICQKYGSQARIIIEEKLYGDEISLLAFVDGRNYHLLQPSQDHKQIYDNDRGPNTGGMGAFCPVPDLSERLWKRIIEDTVEPTLRGIHEEGIVYRGVLYFGLMITAQGPRVLEYNVRLGDPEAQVVLPALKTDLLDIITACIEGELSSLQLEFNPGYFADIVMAMAGYPGKYEKDRLISGLQSYPGLVFHAGTRMEKGSYLTAGGRVLNVVGQGENLSEAVNAAYQGVKKISFPGQYYRKDIGNRLNPVIKSFV